MFTYTHSFCIKVFTIYMSMREIYIGFRFFWISSWTGFPHKLNYIIMWLVNEAVFFMFSPHSPLCAPVDLCPCGSAECQTVLDLLPQSPLYPATTPHAADLPPDANTHTYIHKQGQRRVSIILTCSKSQNSRILFMWAYYPTAADLLTQKTPTSPFWLMMGTAYCSLTS